MRLLVVEDGPRISEIIKAVLERAEFVVDTLRLRADAREALANTGIPLQLPRREAVILAHQTDQGTISLVGRKLNAPQTAVPARPLKLS